MIIASLVGRPDIEVDSKIYKIYAQFEKLLEELRKKELSEQLIESVNQDVDELNVGFYNGKVLSKKISDIQKSILKQLEKESKIVAKGHYRNMWMAIGIGAIGLPLGTIFGMSMRNMGLMSIGLPIGLSVGMLIGAGMDKKAFEEGRQLDIEMKY